MKRNVMLFGVLILLLFGTHLAGCATTPSTNSTTTITPSTTAPPGTGAGEGTVVEIVAQNYAFDTSMITVTAGAPVTIRFDNRDQGIPHNIAVYTDSSAGTTLYRGPIVTGPTTTTYTFRAPSTPGTYFFRCDPHPETMIGQFVVR
jgi:plastocyanin